MGEAEDKAKIKITIAKPIVGKKVFYFIQSIHAEKGTGAMLPAYRKDGSTTMGGEYIDEQTQQGRLLEKLACDVVVIASCFARILVIIYFIKHIDLIG